MKIKKILLDLDDVLNKFTMSALAHVGCTPAMVYNPEWGFDIVKAANASHPLRYFTPETFWESIDRKFWATVPKSNFCDELVNECRWLVGRDNVCILTSPTKDPDCLAGKLEWIHANLPEWLHRQYLVGPCKHFCAREDSLLIDDSDKNIGAFRANGGLAIMFPHKWNSLHGVIDPYSYVYKQMRKTFYTGTTH